MVAMHLSRMLIQGCLMSALVIAAVAGSGAPRSLAADDAPAPAPPPPPPTPFKRMEAEKEARRACKTMICQAFAKPGDEKKITCDVTKTWLRSQIIERIVGGSYVWPYGHAQCTTSIAMDSASLGKTLAGARFDLNLSEHALTCNIDPRSATRKNGFTIKISVAPKITFDKGKATKVDISSIKTEGSTLASAAVTSLLAVDRVSGLVSSAIASEINDFIFTRCNEVGVVIKPKS